MESIVASAQGSPQEDTEIQIHEVGRIFKISVQKLELLSMYFCGSFLD